MGAKSINKPRETVTHYEGEILSKMRSADDLKNSLSAGSKNRLEKYQKDLSVSRGTIKPGFDGNLKDLLLKYAYSEDVVKEALRYLNSLRDGDGYLFSRDLKIYSKTQEAMERFAQADHSSFRWNENYRKSLEWMKQMVSSCHLKPEKYETDDDILQAIPKVDTHSGYTFVETGVKQKGKNVEGLCRKHKERKRRIRTGLPVAKRPILIGFRTQASGEYEDDGTPSGHCKHKTRVVSMFDLLDIVDELQFSNPFQRWINLQEFYAGGKDNDYISIIISNNSYQFTKFMSIDYSSFDQTISSWLIEDAFDVVRSAFDLTPGQAREFHAVVDRFIHKDFILNEGIIHADKGVPSGSMFTQIIDTIVNVIVVNTYFNAIGKACKMIAMGDDNAIFCDEGIKIEELASYISKNFGLIIKTDDKSNEGLTSRDRVKFLSSYWTPGGRWRHPNQLISRMLFPERWRDYTGEVKPEHVLFAYILTYKAGMCELINVPKFIRDYPISKAWIEQNVDSRYVPGSLAYIREYTKVS